MGEDIVVDAVGKKSQLCRYIIRVEVESEIGLKTIFRLKILITDLITERTFVYTIRCQFADIGSTEAACQIQTEVEMLVNVTDSSHASRQTIETAYEISKT